VPVDLLGRRADIAAARWRVEAALREVQGARAQFYPNINLAAFAGLASIGLDRLLRADSEQYGAGPALHLPIFDAGLLRARLSARTSESDAAVESYNASVLEALHEVADALGSLRSLVLQQAEQARAQDAAESAYGLARQRYQAGLGNYLLVLNAESAVLAQRRLATDLKARALETQIALIRALGGGYLAPAATAGTATVGATLPP
jgi:NodT family efflux transporter outer membrane factor (OMF) lipoprotein